MGREDRGGGPNQPAPCSLPGRRVGPDDFGPRCQGRRGTATRGRGQDVNKPTRGGGRGDGGAVAKGRGGRAVEKTWLRPSQRQVRTGPTPPRASAARASTPRPPPSQGPHSPQGYRFRRPPPRSALPERAIRVPGVSARRAQPAPLAEELLEQGRGHACHGQAGVAPPGAR